ncbi:hypothetical protein AZC_3687 [Azorhizobium caulinodans ORS 571]|uniref:DUF3574 domain-containing protein n=1 Tax=Azorhizobium caulinodans (strain ATCC 43989 / DSM 5975 / JCM 20966 / LMG 6465 / NBRC 14845 / NCIMB 13405 / ORS 571) TaxID=438753 RepID=A8IN06_AZOC5|nr:hypothetical protein AZC_3687 [Azorhizobium caulinodans ORS 571]
MASSTAAVSPLELEGHRRSAAVPFRPLLVPVVLLCGLTAAAAQGQAPAPAASPGWAATPWADSVMLETQLFFSLSTADGAGVSEQQFAQFMEDVVRPRFPDGMTVLDAYGQGAGAAGGIAAMLHAGTKMVLLVHPNTPDAQSKVGEVKAQYKARFPGAGIRHLDFPVRITP